MLTLNIFCNCRSNQHSGPESTRAGWSEETSEVWHKKTKETATTAATRTRSGRNSAGWGWGHWLGKWLCVLKFILKGCDAVLKVIYSHTSCVQATDFWPKLRQPITKLDQLKTLLTKKIIMNHIITLCDYISPKTRNNWKGNCWGGRQEIWWYEWLIVNMKIFLFLLNRCIGNL